jgi:hypothetical protein
MEIKSQPKKSGWSEMKMISCSPNKTTNKKKQQPQLVNSQAEQFDSKSLNTQAKAIEKPALNSGLQTPQLAKAGEEKKTAFDLDVKSMHSP